ncbi:hypothetical protein V6N12_050293 [Hibiscus sabdariffa]|uniref:Uncharacterized protein n=1 Tax=Hibiscus sabdariffa TaxID=183260 RepID=A0ABR2GDP9_9ROSI
MKISLNLPQLSWFFNEEDIIEENLSTMDISISQKRKRLFKHNDEAHNSKKRKTFDLIAESVIELRPGNWGTHGFGTVEDDALLKLVFSHFLS